MNDTMQNNPQGQVPEPDPASLSAAAKADLLQQESRAYYGPDRLAEASAALARLQKFAPVRLNFDPNNEFPAGYGLAFVPLAVRTEAKDEKGVAFKFNKITGIVAAAVPDVATIAATEKGASFIGKTVINALMAQVANAARPQADGTLNPLPFSLEDFIEATGKGREGVKSFTTIAPAWVAVIRQKGIKTMTTPMLRQCLMSTDFAKAVFPAVAQQTWQQVGEGMIAQATKKGLDPAIIRHWLDTRDQTASSDTSFDLEGIDFDKIGEGS
jgi:hypothetical protein